MAAHAQPAPSWAELTSRLEAVLRHVDNAATLGEVPCDLGGVLGAVDAVLAGDAAPSPADRERLVRVLARTGERFVALERRLQGSGLAQLPGKQLVVDFACNFIQLCMRLAIACRFTATEARRFAACTALVLNAGAGVCSAMAAALAGPQPQLADLENAPASLTLQASALHGLLSLLGSTGTPQPTVLSLAPPGDLLRWLRAAAAALEALQSLQHGRGDALHKACCCLAASLAVLAADPAYQRHQRLLLESDSLCRCLTALLAPTLSWVAACLQLPAERRPPQYTCQAASQLAVALASLCGGCTQQLAELDALRVLEAAAQVVVRTLDVDDLSSAVLLLDRVAGLCLLRQLWDQRVPAPQAARLVPLLLSALPKVASVLPEAAAQHELGVITSCCIALGNASKLLNCMLGGDVWRPRSLRDVESCCTKTAAAVRVLVPLAEAGSQPGTRLSQVAADATAATCTLAVQVTAALLRHALAARDAATSGAGAVSTGLAAVEAALWQLHSTLCRALHASGATTHVLHEAAATCLATAAVYTGAANATAAVAAMCAAQFELLQAVPPAPSEWRGVCAGLTVAVRYGPRAIAAHPDTEAMFARLEERLKQHAAGISFGLFCHPMVVMPLSPSVTAHLVLNGSLRLLLSHALDNDSAGQSSWMAARTWHTLESLRCIATTAAAEGSQAADSSTRTLAAALEQPASELGVVLELPVMDGVTMPGLSDGCRALATMQRRALPPASDLARALLQWWRRPEQAAADALALARVAAARSCAYLRCANLACEGGPAAGEGVGSSRCSRCRAVWYCNETCSHADWGGQGHRRSCRALGAERAAAKAAAAAARREQGQQAGGAGPSSS